MKNIGNASTMIESAQTLTGKDSISTLDFSGMENCIIDCIQDALDIIDLQGFHLLVNEAFCEMTGFSKEELLGVGIPHPYWPPEEKESIMRDYESMRSGNMLPCYKMVFLRKNGERFPVRVTPSLLRDPSGKHAGFTASLRDLSQECAAHEQVEVLSSAIDQSGTCVLITNVSGEIEYVSSAVEKLTGYSRRYF